MATSVFSPCEGGVAKVPLCANSGGGSNGGVFSVGSGYTPFSFPTSGFILEMSGNYQFLHSLDQFIYYYNFGDRVGELTVSGFGFADSGSCSGGVTDTSKEVCGIYDYYLQNKQSKTKKATQMSLNNCGSFWAFLTGMRIEMSASAGGTPIGQWSLRYHVIPDTKGSS